MKPAALLLAAAAAQLSAAADDDDDAVGDGAAPRGWRAGVAQASITPPEPMWMSGYASRDRPAEGTRTELWAKALALEDAAGNRALLITLDLVGIDRPTALALCRAAGESTGLERHQIVIATSHTHTGPAVRDNLRSMYFLPDEEWAKIAAYAEWLQGRAADAAARAVAALAPAELAWGTGHETFGVNRRNNFEPAVPRIRAAGQLRGPADYRVPVLRVVHTGPVPAGEGGGAEAGGEAKPAAADPDRRRLAAVVFGYACHATVLSDFRWSGDYPGFAQIALERDFPGATALFVAGCGADINPLPRRTAELAESYGKRLAAAAGRVLGGVMEVLPPELETVYREIPLPYEKVPTRAELEAESGSENRYRARRAQLLLAQVDGGEPLSPTYPYPVGTWRLGGLSFVTLGGEVVVDYPLRVRAELGENVWVAGYCHDVMAYIPSRRVWDEGGYEGATATVYYGLPARWDNGVEEAVMAEVHRQAAAVAAGRP